MALDAKKDNFNKELYELNLGAFNSIFGFPSIVEFPYRHVPKDFNLDAFRHEVSSDY